MSGETVTAPGNGRRVQVRAVRKGGFSEAKKQVIAADGEIRAAHGRTVQRRKAARGFFTEAKKQVFFDHLATCCNVTRSAAAAGVCTSTIDNHRRRDPAFAAAMGEALEAGYELLESLLMERAANLAGYQRDDEATAVAPETIDTELAIRLLQLRGRRPARSGAEAARGLRRADEDALAEKIQAKLKVLALRRRRARAARAKAKRGKAAQ